MKAGKKRMRVRPRPFRLAGYLFWLAAMVVSYLMFRSFLLLFFAAFLCLIPIISIVCGLVLAHFVRCRVKVPVTDRLRPGDEVFPAVILENPLWIGTLDARVHMRIYNSFFRHEEDAEKLMVSLPAIARGIRNTRGEATLRMPFTTTRIGNDRILVETMEVQDWLGHSSASTTLNFYAHIDKTSKVSIADALDNIVAIA